MSDLQDRLQASLGASYRIQRELGGGGMSRVFLAEEPRLGRRVVIKLLPPETSAGVHSDRFEREIQVAASLQHPHVVPLLTTGAADGLFYYIMPFIEGESLATRIAREGALPVHEVTRILRDVVDALAYAHSRGVVHRDIKPANILFAGRHALVTDFGVAKALSVSSGGQGTSLTSLGVALGTPAYMAPEQAAADPHLDHRADIYAVGVVAYELLAGRTPFVAPTPQGMLAAHITAAPEPVTNFRPGLSAELAAVVMRSLEKHPADRWQSAAELLARLEALATPSGGSLPVETAPAAGVRESAERAIRRAQPLRVVGLFLLATVVVTAGVFGLTRALGLPDWIWVAALGCMLAGLPIMLYTGRLERQRAVQRATGTFRFDVEPAHRRWFTWRRALLGGAISLGLLVLVSAGYGISRKLGIGPAGTLLSSGRLGGSDRIVLADFANRTADSTLASSVSEALRVDLGQSRAIRLVEPAAIKAALQRMNRAPATPLDEALAREVAQRAGAKAVVAGEIAPIGKGYVLTARVVSADSGITLVPVRETAATDAELIEAINRLSTRLRERIGESLKEIRGSDPLDEVTTASLPALRLYSRANRAFEVNDLDTARELLERAVAIDTSFAMAWRKLGAVYNNLGSDPSKRDQAIFRSYQHRDRLPPLERYLTEGGYYWRNDRQPERSIAAYRAALDVDPENIPALNNLGMMLVSEGRGAEAEIPLRRGIEVQPNTSFYNNLTEALVAQHKWAAAESVVARARADLPGQPASIGFEYQLALARRDFDRAESVLKKVTPEMERGSARRQLAFAKVDLHELHGRLRASEAALDELGRAAKRDGDRGMALDLSLASPYHDAIARGDPAAALARVAELLREHPLDSIGPRDRPYFSLATVYAFAGRSAEVRRARAEWERAREAKTRHPSDPRWWDGYVALSESRWADAARAFEAAHDVSHCEPCGRLHAAFAWDRGGMADSAIAAYESVWQTPLTDQNHGEYVLMMPLGLSRLGALYEQKGNREKALLYYGKFVELWRGADAEVQPFVADARKRIAALSGEPRPRSP